MSDIFSQGLALLGQVAPTLATMIGGPLAGTTVSALESVFGLSSDGSSQDRQQAALKAVASATPEQLLALKAEDNRHAETLEKLGLDKDALVYGDRASARQREVNTRDWTPRLMAFIALGGFIAMVAYVLAGHMDMSGNAVAVFGTVIGYVSSKADLVLSYYFGSSVAADQHAAAFRQQLLNKS